MKNNPLVSIVVPTFNHGHFLEKALQSVVDQSYEKWEIIVIDNHSSDNTNEIFEKFSSRKIRLLKIHNNGSIAASRNMGILNATGGWVAFLDSDDYWYPTRLQAFVSDLTIDDGADVYSANELQINFLNGEERNIEYGPFSKNFYKDLLIYGNKLSPSSAIVDINFMRNHKILFREQIKYATVEDYDFWMLLAKAGAKFYFNQSIQGVATIHGKNSSAAFEKHQQNLANLLKDHVYFIQDFESKKDSLWKKINARILLLNAAKSIRDTNNKLFIKSIYLALEYSMINTLYWLAYAVTRRCRKL